jgi:hypothetical protein
MQTEVAREGWHGEKEEEKEVLHDLRRQLQTAWGRISSFAHANNAALNGNGHGVRAVEGTELLEDEADVEANGAHAEIEQGDDLLGRVAFHQQAKDLEFA